MKLVSVEKKEGSKIELSIVVEKDEFEAACEKSYRKNVKGINVQGFRKGKAPRKLIEKMYGEEIFHEDAINFCCPEAYEKAVDEADIEPIAQPDFADLDINEEKEVSFKATVQVKPEVEIGEYKGLEAEKTAPKVDKSEIDDEIERLRERNSRLITVEGEAKDGDTAVIDFEGFLDGVPFDGGKGENYSLKIGSNTFIPGFEEQLLGLKAGDEKDVNVTFPEEYHSEDLAGKAVVFKCKVNEVKETEKPELDDEFAKDVSEFDTLDEFRADIEKRMLENKTRQADADFDEALWDKLTETLKAEIPEIMIESQTDRTVDDFAYRLSMQGLGLDMYLQMNQMDMPTFREMFKGQAERQVKVRLALEKVAELEKVEVSQEELDAEVERLAGQYGITGEKVLSAIGANGIKRDLKVQKAMNIIRDSAKAVKPKAKKAAKADSKAENAASAEEKPKAKKASKPKAEKTEDAPTEETKPAKKPTAKKGAAPADKESGK